MTRTAPPRPLDAGYVVEPRVLHPEQGELNVFACPSDPGHPHRWSIQ
ncbi:hypothetical protein [Streptomyces sp. NBC_01276]